MRYVRAITIALVCAFALGALAGSNPAQAATAAELDRDANRVLGKLYAKIPAAKALGEKAKGVLVFPAILKGGFIVGGQYGEGALLKDGKTVAYYETVSGSYGLQIGAQKYGYAMFFMTDAALKYLDKSDGWELGTAPNIVVWDEGMAGGFSTTTLSSDTYAFFFAQEGLMAGLGLQGTKITKIRK
ncbi:MAG: twin-arginine translocation pathway signal [Deltaproteobacteria bacterium]|nr:twin-arginine translocation pathway signal [Deltaproteobacteria bacterium]